MDVNEELELIRKRNNGFLRPQEVVEFARDPETALHSRFDWDDSTAAEKYRLAQAKAIIRVSVVTEPNKSQKIRAYVSLSQDRIERNGYRATVDVLDDELLREILLQDALNELQAFHRKYEKLKDAAGMAEVLTTIESILADGAKLRA